MPNKSGPGTYKGYESPESSGWPGPIRETVRKTYGAWRSKHPRESKAIKTRGSRIAWATARRKYPALYHSYQKEKIAFQKDVRQERKEHPWSSRAIATKITMDHWRKAHRKIPVRSMPMKSKTGSKKNAGYRHHSMRERPGKMPDMSGDRIASVTGGRG